MECHVAECSSSRRRRSTYMCKNCYDKSHLVVQTIQNGSFRWRGDAASTSKGNASAHHRKRTRPNRGLLQQWTMLSSCEDNPRSLPSAFVGSLSSDHKLSHLHFFRVRCCSSLPTPQQITVVRATQPPTDTKGANSKRK